MKTTSKKLYTVSGLYSIFNHAKTLELLCELTDINYELELVKRKLLYDFKENDAQAQELIDDVELKQYYVGKNIETAKDVLLIHESKLIQRRVCFGLNSVISLN